ncbi:MAG: rod shape-determining protein MreD [Lachnospiraceae bacterium]|nr:rod shape-determining protein MreD [Lachnospiraceae bacterium]
MKEKIIGVIIVIFSFICQVTICKFIALNDIGPNLLVIVAASFGFLYGKKPGIIAGFFIGLLFDVFCGNILGFYALLFMYIGFFNSFFKQLVYKDELPLQLLLVGVSDLFYGIIVYLLLFLLRGKFHFGYYTLHIILPEVIYTVILEIIVFFIGSLIRKIIPEETDRSEKKEIA